MTKIKKTALSPARITAIYFFTGLLWIIGSSLWARHSTDAENDIFYFELAKGSAFVLVTSGLLLSLCHVWAGQIRSALNKYETYVKKSPLPIILFRSNGQMEDVNNAACEISGYSREELLAATIFDLDASQDPEDTMATFARIFTLKTDSFERRVKTKNGEFRNLQIEGVELEGGKVLYFAKDITQRKADERKLITLNSTLRAIRNVNRAIVEESEVDPLIQRVCSALIRERDFNFVWITLFDQTGDLAHYADASSYKLKALDLKADSLTGPLKKHIAGNRRSDGLSVATDSLGKNPELPLPDELGDNTLVAAPIEHDGLNGHIGILAQPDSTSDEEGLSLIKEMSDELTHALRSIKQEKDKEQAHADLMLAKQEAEKANKAKDEFLAVMSHEMRTPLNPIMGLCEVMREETSDAGTLAHLNQIKQSADSLLRLIDEVLYFTQLQINEDYSEKTNFDILECCRNALEKAPAPPEGVRLNFRNGSTSLSPVPENKSAVFGDQGRIDRILANLLSNACKYTKEGEITLRVGQRNASTSTAEFVFEVEDTGIGIDSTDIPGLFTPFTQVDSSYSRPYEGIGLGLAISKKLARLMGGNITVESSPGRGSCFTFYCTMELDPDFRSALRQNPDSGHCER
ncbi:MAG: ATP-binding protein [Opitutales bacterium]